MSDTITKVTWYKKGKGKKSGRTESAYFKHESALRFARQLESEQGVSDIRLVVDLGIKDVR
jgi:hypothetical protein